MHTCRSVNENTGDFKARAKRDKEIVEQYGDALICVRYRYDAKARKQYKTVEIIAPK